MVYAISCIYILSTETSTLAGCWHVKRHSYIPASPSVRSCIVSFPLVASMVALLGFKFPPYSGGLPLITIATDNHTLLLTSAAAVHFRQSLRQYPVGTQSLCEGQLRVRLWPRSAVIFPPAHNTYQLTIGMTRDFAAFRRQFWMKSCCP